MTKYPTPPDEGARFHCWLVQTRVLKNRVASVAQDDEAARDRALIVVIAVVRYALETDPRAGFSGFCALARGGDSTFRAMTTATDPTVVAVAGSVLALSDEERARLLAIAEAAFRPWITRRQRNRERRAETKPRQRRETDE